MFFMQMIMKEVKAMKFDDAETKVENLVGDLNIPLGVESTLLDVIDKLREEYAPNVEMTKKQFNLIEKHPDSIVWAVGSFEEWETWDDFNDDFWEPLTQREVVQAWLHPETIKVVDE